MFEGCSSLSHILELANLALKDVGTITIQPVLYGYFLFRCCRYKGVGLYHPGADSTASLVTSCGE